MKNRLQTIILVFFLSFISVKVQAQWYTWLGFTPLSDTVASEREGLAFLPLIYYTPDTRWAAGAAGVYFFKVAPKDSSDKETRISFNKFLADYTQNKQLDVWNEWNIFTRNENYLWKGELRYRDFPDRFYGIGNNSFQEDEERYQYSLVSFKNLLLKRVNKNLFLGFDYNFTHQFRFKYFDSVQLHNGSIDGFKGGTGSAIGLVGVFDSRDNIVNCFNGTFAEISSYFYHRYWGSTFSFFNINASYHSYREIKPKHVIAFQSRLRLNRGNVPFLNMATLGDNDLLRGYAANRYRDVHFLGGQVEYRFPLFWRFGANAFVGGGEIFSQPNQIDISQLKYSVGAGLRFVIATAERINIRFDYAYGREGGTFYFNIAEAF